MLTGGIYMTRLLRTWVMFARWDMYDTRLLHSIPSYRQKEDLDDLDRDLSDVCSSCVTFC